MDTDDRTMEANWRQITAEEKRSARIGMCVAHAFRCSVGAY
jgi:hypothetical protein